MGTSNGKIVLDVGGYEYKTTMEILTKYPSSKLACIFTQDAILPPILNSKYCIDRNGIMFKYVLNYLEWNRLLLPSDFYDYNALYEEAEYFGIQPMCFAIENMSTRAEARSCKHYIAFIIVNYSLPVTGEFSRTFTQATNNDSFKASPIFYERTNKQKSFFEPNTSWHRVKNTTVNVDKAVEYLKNYGIDFYQTCNPHQYTEAKQWQLTHSIINIEHWSSDDGFVVY